MPRGRASRSPTTRQCGRPRPSAGSTSPIRRRSTSTWGASAGTRSSPTRSAREWPSTRSRSGSAPASPTIPRRSSAPDACVVSGSWQPASGPGRTLSVQSRVRPLVFAFAALVLFPEAAAAICRAEPLCQTYHQYAAVFEGTVTSAREGLLTFRVERSWKGVSPGDVEVAVPTGRRTNRADAAPGRRYLVLASRDTGDRLTADGCTIKPVEAAFVDARFLDSLARPSRGGRLEIYIDDG